MGQEMCKVLPGLYVGSCKAEDKKRLLKSKKITHILAIHEDAKPIHKDITYKCIKISDLSKQNIAKYFEESIKFIHECRMNGGSVLVHCVYGISRSVTLVTAYVMVIGDLTWKQSLLIVKTARLIAYPNEGFKRQLRQFGEKKSRMLADKLMQEYPDYDYSYDKSLLEYILYKMETSPPLM